MFEMLLLVQLECCKLPDPLPKCKEGWELLVIVEGDKYKYVCVPNENTINNPPGR
jgi:hypothetical protein